MKKILIYSVCALIASAVYADPDPALKRTFSRTFPTASNVKWSDDKDGYFVSFTLNGCLEKVFYDKTGNFICSWRYAGESELPPMVLSVIGKNYKDSKILGATEVATPNTSFYEVKLGTNKYWYSIKVSPNGEVIEQKRFDK